MKAIEREGSKAAEAGSLWAVDTQSARELADVQQSYMEMANREAEMDRFLGYKPKTEDKIKAMLRALDTD